MGKLYHVLLKTVLSFILMVIFTGTAMGQRTVTGKVTDDGTGEGVIGANVVVIGTTVGAVTDFDGSYKIDVPAGYDRLSFSYTGYSTVEVQVTTSDVIDVVIGEGKILDEVVLIGYGTVRRVDATGAVQTVSSDKFNRGSITGAQELIAGKLPGVVITTSDGSPGAGATIRIRGESSLTASRDPLIVIDGVPVENTGVSGGRNFLNIINPNDIETFTVLKDASAAAIYGNRASGGVILITTKKGSVDSKLKIGYNGSLSTSDATGFVDALNADEYRALIDTTFAAGHDVHELLGGADTYWQEEIYQSAMGFDHNLYLSGGVAQIPFRVSLGYTDKEGILKRDEFNRITAGFNLNPGFLSNTLQVNLNFKSMFTNNHFGNRAAIGNALNFDPTQTIFDSTSVDYGGYTTWTNSTTGLPNTLGPTNPRALIDLRDDNSEEKRFLTNVAIDYRIPFIPALRANLNIGYDYARGEGTVFVDTFASFAFDPVTGGGVNNIYNQTKINSLLEFYLNYKKQFGKSDIDLMGGYSWQHFEVDNFSRNSDLRGTPSKTSTDASPAEYYLLSLFGRLNYGFDDKYLLTLTLRRDGTSRFSPENRWGLFPAAALAIKVLENDRNTFNDLKVRLGWGLTGQQDVDDYYAYLARYQIGNDFAKYQLGDQFITTLRPNGYDSKIQWEETSTYNLGIDFSIIRNRFSGSVDVYQRYTDHLLNRIPVPAGTNLTNFVTTNVGSMESGGFELALFTTPIVTSKVTWDISANFAYNNSEITKLTLTSDTSYAGVLTGGIATGVGSTIQIHSVGYAPSSFYVYEQLYNENGDLIENSFVDKNNDGVINDLDKNRIEGPAADYTIGLTSKLRIGQFDLSFAGRGSIGNLVYNNVQTDMGYIARLYGSTDVLWNVNQSAVDLNVTNQASLTYSDYFVKKADFVKIDHITIGYNFDKVIGDFFRIYATAQNPFVFTSYDGIDPEIFNGIDNSIYPRPRTFVFGINVEF